MQEAKLRRCYWAICSRIVWWAIYVTSPICETEIVSVIVVCCVASLGQGLVQAVGGPVPKTGDPYV